MTSIGSWGPFFESPCIYELNARTFLLTTANPRELRWNKNKAIIENTELPRTLQSRFYLT